MDLPVVNHKDYFAKIGDDHKFPIEKFGELANYLIKKAVFFILSNSLIVMQSLYLSPPRTCIEMIEHNEGSVLNNKKIKDLLSQNNFKLIKNFDFNYIYKKENQ